MRLLLPLRLRLRQGGVGGGVGGGCCLVHPRALCIRMWSCSAAVFDRRLKQLQKNMASQQAQATDFDYLRDEVARRLVCRLQDIKRTFPVALDLGCGHGHIAKQIDSRTCIQTLVQMESSRHTLERAKSNLSSRVGGPELEYVLANEEFLPLQPQSVDLIMSSLSLHWVNDLPGTLQQIRKSLKPDAVFLAALIGGKSLQELRSAFALADTERAGGLSPHISPMVNASDVAGLVQSAGFSLPTVDHDFITSLYPDMFTLCEHLQAMGESNVAHARRPFVSRDVFVAAASAYEALYAADYDGLIPATFHIIYLIGWAPAASQPKPLKQGSAQFSLKDLAKDPPGENIPQ